MKCNFCGSEKTEARLMEYLYSHQGKYLLVPDTPAEVCLDCGMIYYDAAVLKTIEERFQTIHRGMHKPERYISIPVENYAS